MAWWELNSALFTQLKVDDLDHDDLEAIKPTPPSLSSIQLPRRGKNLASGATQRTQLFPSFYFSRMISGFSLLSMHCCYISFRVLFQTKSSLVWKSYTQKLRTIFQTNSSLVWKEKNWFCKTQIPNQIQIGLENFDDHCQCPENSKPNSVWFGKIIDYCQRLEPWTNSSFILEISF